MFDGGIPELPPPQETRNNKTAIGASASARRRRRRDEIDQSSARHESQLSVVSVPKGGGEPAAALWNPAAPDPVVVTVTVMLAGLSA